MTQNHGSHRDSRAAEERDMTMSCHSDIKKTSAPTEGSDVFCLEHTRNPSPASKGGRGKIIIVERDEAIRTLLTHWAATLGGQVQTMAYPDCSPHSPSPNASPCQSPCCELLLMDNHPACNQGIETLQRQKQSSCPLHPERKALLCSVRTPATLEMVKELGCRHFLKPLHIKELSSWARSLLALQEAAERPPSDPEGQTA